MIHFNQPHLTGKEVHYMYDAVYLVAVPVNFLLVRMVFKKLH